MQPAKADAFIRALECNCSIAKTVLCNVFPGGRQKRIAFLSCSFVREKSHDIVIAVDPVKSFSISILPVADGQPFCFKNEIGHGIGSVEYVNGLCMQIEEDIILIAGPTASGKTSCSIELALANDGVIVNTDSMQVYEELRIISARPSVEEEAQVPHYLFGHRSGSQHYSVAQWIEDVRPLLQQFLGEGRKMFFVGGTGQYFNTMLEGISHIPDVDEAIRASIRAMEDVATQDMHQMLDEKAAQEIRPSDRQRIKRALEVFQSSGKSIVDWQAEKGVPLVPENVGVKKFLVMPARAEIHERINRRFDLMVEAGALEEVKALLERGYEKSLPVMKAIGVPQLAACLAGDMTLEEAIEKAKAATRQYAKRQTTWFNNSFDDEWRYFPIDEPVLRG